MKKILTLLACMAFATPSIAAPIAEGKVNSVAWYMCKDVKDVNAVLDSAVKDGVDASYVVWHALVGAGACKTLQMPINALVAKVLRQEKVAGITRPLSILELKIGSETVYAISGEQVDLATSS